MREVGAKVGRPQTTVRNVLIRNEVEIRPRKGQMHQKLSDAEFDRTRQLYESGLTQQEVAEVLGITPGAVLWRLRRAGVPRRDKGESIRRGWEKRRRLLNSTASDPAG